jgi:hypothetical protein
MGQKRLQEAVRLADGVRIVGFSTLNDRLHPLGLQMSPVANARCIGNIE